MNLDERSNQLFMSILHNPKETSKQLMKKFNLSRGQLNYDNQKINDWLKEQQLEKIERTKSGYFIVPNEVRKKYQTKKTTITKQDFYLFSMLERMYLLELMLLSKEEFISLNHLIDALQFSKNTVLRSLKEVEQNLTPYHLKLNYSRARGYYIDGKEWDKRQLLRDALNLLAGSTNSSDRIGEFAQLDGADIKCYKEKFETIEKELNVRFTDEQMTILPYYFPLILRRIAKGKTIKYNFEIDFEVLVDTQEYKATKEITGNIYISEEEKIYLTLQLLATNVSSSDTLTKGELTRMELALNEVLTLFEKGSAIKIEHRAKLLNQLMQHMKPAYYRIKYQMNLKNLFYEANREQMTSLFYLVKESLHPLNVFFNKPIPDVEVFFISLFIGSHILDTSDSTKINKQLKAAIVCPNGISVSILLEKTLRKLFPELNFLPVMSIREFYLQNPEVNYVFSATPIQTDKQLFVVKSFLTEIEKRQLRQRVFQKIENAEKTVLTPEKIIKIIKKHGAIKDEQSLYHELLEMIDNEWSDEKDLPLTLTDLLKKEYVQVFTEDLSWAQTIEALGKPLVDKKIITPHYISKIITDYPTIPAHIVLRETIALPHTEAEYGALGVGMSLGIIQKGLPFNEKKIYLVVLIASNDKKKHIEAVLQLMDLAGKEQIIAKLERASSKKEIVQVINEFMLIYGREKNESKAIRAQ